MKVFNSVNDHCVYNIDDIFSVHIHPGIIYPVFRLYIKSHMLYLENCISLSFWNILVIQGECSHYTLMYMESAVTIRIGAICQRVNAVQILISSYLVIASTFISVGGSSSQKHHTWCSVMNDFSVSAMRENKVRVILRVKSRVLIQTAEGAPVTVSII